MKITLSKNQRDAFIISIGFLFFPSYMRSTFLPHNIAWFNFVAVIGLFLLMSHKNTCSFSIKKRWLILIYLLLTVLYAVSYMKYRADLFYAMSLYVSWIVPLFLIFMEISKDKFLAIFKTWLKVLNFMVYFITICFIADRFLGIEFSEFFRVLYGGTDSGISAMSANMLGNRLVSYLGHPLFTTEMVLIFYVCNYIYDKLFINRRLPIIYILVSFFDIALVGSKAGIVIIASIALLHNFQNKRFRYMFILAFIGALMYSIGVFDTVIQRFIQGIQSGDLTSSRSSAWVKLFETGIYSINMWTGQWTVDSTQTTLVAATEYPFIRWSFLIGSVFSGVLSTVLFVFPIFKLLKLKQFKILIGMIAIILDVNTFNTISTQKDALLLYCWFVFLVLGAANFLSYEGGRHINNEKDFV